MLGGDASWDDLGAALEQHAAFLRRWCAEQEVQTNEVQRSWALLPAFLSLADGRPFDLLELGPSAGLNLLWDRYAYRYATGDVGERGAPAFAATTGCRRRRRCSSGASRSYGAAAST